MRKNNKQSNKMLDHGTKITISRDRLKTRMSGLPYSVGRLTGLLLTYRYLELDGREIFRNQETTIRLLRMA